MIFDESKLIASLNKYYRPLTVDQYKDDMDLIDVQNAIEIAGIPKQIANGIWKKTRAAFEVF